jgi:hypothetical protein
MNTLKVVLVSDDLFIATTPAKAISLLNKILVGSNINQELSRCYLFNITESNSDELNSIKATLKRLLPIKKSKKITHEGSLLEPHEFSLTQKDGSAMNG